ncbi:hypothetical protein HK104_004360 [Borealophlyctis nickersoniae]|nr:hypothetical protein HK104_004360 [Borealophlyctis nickersoniae]
MELLTSIVAATALIKFATIVVEVLMLYVMSDRKQYSRAKFDYAEDFAEARMRHELRKQGREVITGTPSPVSRTGSTGSFASVTPLARDSKSFEYESGGGGYVEPRRQSGGYYQVSGSGVRLGNLRGNENPYYQLR